MFHSYCSIILKKPTVFCLCSIFIVNMMNNMLIMDDNDHYMWLGLPIWFFWLRKKGQKGANDEMS